MTAANLDSMSEPAPDDLTEALRAAEDAEDAAEADAAMAEPGDSIPWEELKAEFGL